jgi:hypothetical protein
MDKQTSHERGEIRDFITSSGFTACESSDVFEALGDLADFTLGERPDVVLLGVDSCDEDLPIVRQMAIASGGVPILALSPKASDRLPKIDDWYFRGDLAQVTNRLNKLIPASAAH